MSAGIPDMDNLPAGMRSVLEISHPEKQQVHDAEKHDSHSMSGENRSVVQEGVLEVDPNQTQYTAEQYKELKRKIDWTMLPLMWLCYGIQQADKTSISIQATFGLKTDTGLVGQQYAWLTTIFYIMYMVCEFPSTFIVQRFRMGLVLSIYMVIWGVVVLCIGFAHNFKQLIALRALQGVFECCISPGFILVVGTWYTTNEHVSRSLVFQSANAGFSIIASLVLYGIGTVEFKDPEKQSWRYMSYFLGGLTILTGLLCLLFLGTPTEVRWLTPEQKEMASARIRANNTGNDRTGVKTWKWSQAKECLLDPCFWFAGLTAFLSSVPNGGLTVFGAIVLTGFGFTPLQVILLGIPYSVVSLLWFVVVGLCTSRWKNLRLYFMMLSVIPPLCGFLVMSLLPGSDSNRWTKYGGYLLTSPFVMTLFLAWTLIPSNIAGRTKRTITSSLTFVGYCVGNMVGSQIFLAKDAPRYIPGTTGSAVCFGLELLVLVMWRLVLSRRNARRDEQLQEMGLTDEDRIAKGKELGDEDMTDFENIYFRYTM